MNIKRTGKENQYEKADFLLEHELIDELKIKLYPLLFGRGIRLFGKSTKALDLSLTDSKAYKNGALLLAYKLNYLFPHGRQ